MSAQNVLEFLLPFSGLIDLGGWSRSLGDFVDEVRRDPESEEAEIVRYRLVEPF